MISFVKVLQILIIQNTYECKQRVGMFNVGKVESILTPALTHTFSSYVQTTFEFLNSISAWSWLSKCVEK